MNNKQQESMNKFLDSVSESKQTMSPRGMKSILEYQKLKQKILDEHSEEDKELLEKIIQTLKHYLKDKEEL